MMSLFDTDKTALMEYVLERYAVSYNPGRMSVQKIQCIDPAHEDRNPSASLHLGEGWFKCHSCGLKGDGYNILRELEGWDVKRVNDAFGGEPISDGAWDEEWV